MHFAIIKHFFLSSCNIRTTLFSFLYRQEIQRDVALHDLMPICHSFRQLEGTYDIEIILLSTLVGREVLDPLPACKPKQTHILKEIFGLNFATHSRYKVTQDVPASISTTSRNLNVSFRAPI